MSIEDLRKFAAGLNPGELDDDERACLESLLADGWDDFNSGDDHGAGMEPYKLRGRMERVKWNPPELTFMIERHGATVLGSSRAELQSWTLDFNVKTRTFEEGGFRQKRPRKSPVRVDRIVDKLAEQILNHHPDDRLSWSGHDQVRIMIGKILPKGSAVPQTLSDRRRRLRDALAVRLEPAGWKMITPNVFRHDIADGRYSGMPEERGDPR